MIRGFVAPGFEPVAEAFETAFQQGEELGAGFCALIDGEVAVDIQGGHADRARTRAWDADTLVPVYSTTKPVAALVIARLHDRGLLDLEQSIGVLWPEFLAHGKDVTIAQALSHQAGVPGFVRPIDPALWLDPPALSAALAALEPMWAPGSANGYHPLTYGYIAGELARRAEGGRTLGTHLREDVCGPLGIDFWIGLPDGEHHRVAEMAKPKAAPDLSTATPERRAAFLMPWSAPDRGGADWRRAEIPSANGHGTARAVATLYGVLARGGFIGSAQVLGEAALAALTRLRIRGPDRVLPFDCAWAAGLMVNEHLRFGPNPATLGHSGWGGSCGFADPDRGLSAAYVMNRQSTSLVADPRAQRLIGALYGCL